MNASGSRSQSSGQDELRSAWDKLDPDVKVYLGFAAYLVALYPVGVLKRRPELSVRDLIRKEGWGVFYRGSGRVLGGMFACVTATILHTESSKRSRAKEE